MGSTKTRTGEKPCDLKRFRERTYRGGRFSRGGETTKDNVYYKLPIQTPD